MLKPPTGAAELLATIEQSRIEVARLTTLAIRRAMNPELHRDELEAARENERAALELLARLFSKRAASPANGMDFSDLIRAARESAQTNPGESNEPA